MLRSPHADQVPSSPKVASSGWGSDVIGNDLRSVQAYLSGRGDPRAALWNQFSTIYMAITPGATLTHAMCAFHRMHHALTLSWLSYQVPVDETRAELRTHWLLAAMRTAAASTSSHTQ